MRNFKLGFAGLLIIVFGWIYWKNKEFFDQTEDIVLLQMNYTTPQLPYWTFFLVLFVLGFLVAWFFSLIYRMKLKKNIKTMNRTIESQKEKISELESELELMQGGLSGGGMSSSSEESYDEPLSNKEIVYTREGKADEES